MQSPLHTLTAILLIAGLQACGDGGGPTGIIPEIQGYEVSGQASATDPVTQEQLNCQFYTGPLVTGKPLVGSFTASTQITVIRIRTGDHVQVTYDTTITSQDVTLSLESGEYRFSTAGPFTDTLVAAASTAYPGWSSGDWSCGPDHPLSRAQEGVTLTGHWMTQPIVPVPG
jgi:hypothetical protein